ncbi:hypothetical protein RSAG8_13413, partial [Rhizoctonia solani AG-8 WAC10335]
MTYSTYDPARHTNSTGGNILGASSEAVNASIFPVFDPFIGDPADLASANSWRLVLPVAVTPGQPMNLHSRQQPREYHRLLKARKSPNQAVNSTVAYAGFDMILAGCF